MINVYAVLLVGEPFLMQKGNQMVEYGFYRNEYMLASSPEKAFMTAKGRALQLLEKNGVEFIIDRPLEVKADRILSGVPISRLLRHEGFIFFPTTSNDMIDHTIECDNDANNFADVGDHVNDLGPSKRKGWCLASILLFIAGFLVVYYLHEF